MTWREWRRPREEVVWGIFAFGLFFVIFDSLAVSTLSTSSSTAAMALVVIVGCAYVMVGGTLLYRVLVHAKLIANADGLQVCNPFRNDQVLQWSEIVSMKPDRLLIIQCTGDRRVIAWVVQKNGWARYKRVRTSADEAINELGALAGRALNKDPIDFTTPPR